jgi:cytosine/uracil/thiamine/allantoin permease
VIFRGMELVRKLEDWAAPFVLVMTAALVWWAIDRRTASAPSWRRTAISTAAAAS